jgi:anti-anti-sigma factor
MRFEVRRERSGSVPVIAVFGAIDLATAPALRSALSELPRDTAVVVDFSGLSFIDVSGLHVLLDDHAARSGRLHIACPPAGPLPRLLDVTRVPHTLRLYGHRETAIWAARAGSVP